MREGQWAQILGRILSILLWPFRIIGRLFRGQASRTVRKTGAGFVAGQRNGTLTDAAAPVENAPGQNIFFRRLSRPRLSERTASDLTLEEAREYVAQAELFYTCNFPLFTRSDFFYEEVEQDYLNTVLGRDQNSIDAKFLVVMEQFRKALNANTARLYLIFIPLLLIATFALAMSLSRAFDFGFLATAFSLDTIGITEAAAQRYIAEALALVASTAALTLLYQWPYKVTQQQNLLGLDNYITSKFSRINQNFQVAKRRSMNVERNMRMHQAEELKDEAGVWTLAYQWFAMRLLFCEMTVRNALYQIRRNTTLYSVGGLIITAFTGAGVYFAGVASSPAHAADSGLMQEIASVTAIFIFISHVLVTRGATRDTLSVLQANEWNRFHLVNLHQTVRDHVGEDKLQIVTFRDRNRIE